MHLLVPLNDKNLIEPYISCGADEFYMGFYDEHWNEKFGKYSEINRMAGFKKKANQYTFDLFLEMIDRVHSYGKKIFLTLNAPCYTKDQLAYMRENYFSGLKEKKVDGIIVSSFALAREAAEYGLLAVGSTMCCIYNSDIAKFFWEHAGMKRMILPRDLSLKEIDSIHRQLPGVELEAFFMRNGCVFSDGYCLGMHRAECGPICGYLKNSDKQIAYMQADEMLLEQVRDNDFTYSNLFHRHHDACGMCALYRLRECGVSALKIVGRADRTASVMQDIALAKKNVDMVEKCMSETEYLQKMHFPENAESFCKDGMSCYFPEVRF